MKKVKITESQRLMLESLDGVNLHEVSNEEIPGIAQNEKTGKYHMALITRDGHIRALEPNFGQFIFDDSKSAKQYFCSNTERINQVLGDDDMMEGFKMSEGASDYKAVASIDICKVSEGIPASQSPSRKVTQNFSKIKGIKAESEFETAPVEWSDVVSKAHAFLLKIYTNPSKEGLDPFWGEYGLTWDEMIRMLTKLDIIKSVDGGYRLTKFVGNPSEAVKVTGKLLMKMIEKENAPEPVMGETDRDDPMRKKLSSQLPTEPKRTGKTREELLKIIAAKRAEELKRRELDEDSGYPAGTANHPDAPFNQKDLGTSIPDQPKYDKFDVSAIGREIVILKANDGKLFAYYYEDVDREELEPYAEREVSHHEEDEDGKYAVYSDEWDIDGEVVERYVNDNLDYIQVSTEPEGWAEGDKIALITPEIKQEILGTWGGEEQIAQALGGIGEVTSAAGSSGAFVGNMSMNSPIAKSNVASQMSDVIGEVEDESSVKADIINTLQTFTNEKISPLKWLSLEGKLKGIVDKVQTLKDEEWHMMITLIIQTLQTAETHLKKKSPESLENFNRHMAGLNNFITHFSNYMGEATTTVSAGGDSGTFAYDAPVGDGSDFWNAGNKQNKKMPMVKKGGVNEIKARENKNAKTDTQYPDGKFVEFDDCTKFNNNKVAQNGGCSVGAVDNVVKTKGSKNSVISDASIYESTDGDDKNNTK